MRWLSTPPLLFMCFLQLRIAFSGLCCHCQLVKFNVYPFNVWALYRLSAGNWTSVHHFGLATLLLSRNVTKYFSIPFRHSHAIARTAHRLRSCGLSQSAAIYFLWPAIRRQNGSLLGLVKLLADNNNEWGWSYCEWLYRGGPLLLVVSSRILIDKIQHRPGIILLSTFHHGNQWTASLGTILSVSSRKSSKWLLNLTAGSSLFVCKSYLPFKMSPVIATFEILGDI